MFDKMMDPKKRSLENMIKAMEEMTGSRLSNSKISIEIAKAPTEFGISKEDMPNGKSEMEAVQEMKHWSEDPEQVDEMEKNKLQDEDNMKLDNDEDMTASLLEILRKKKEEDLMD